MTIYDVIIVGNALRLGDHLLKRMGARGAEPEAEADATHVR